ncbi:MAG: anti-sigma factor [Elusimicrobia bacterium]|nr:anti-sigma factor [Elusimicrobiota bacterium]
MKLLPDCRDMSSRLSEARDSGRALTLGERLHLLMCAWCRRFRVQLDVLGLAAARAPEGGPSLSAEAKARIRRALGA